MRVEATAARIVVDDVEIAYDDTGTDTGTAGSPLLLVHGLQASRHIWDDLVPQLPDRRIVRFDLPGHGQSGGPADARRYGHEWIGALIQGLARQLDLVGAPVVGHSLGGTSVLRAHLADPDVFGPLVVINSWVYGMPKYGNLIVRRYFDGISKRGVLGLYDCTDQPRRNDPTLGVRFTEDDEFIRRRRDEMADTMPEAYVALSHESCTAPTFFPLVRHLRGPALFVLGAQEPHFGEAMRAMAEIAPGGELVVIDDSGHNTSLDRPAELAAAIEKFLAHAGT